MALMQPQHQEIDTVSIPDNVLSASPSLASSSQEPYYSNHDIAILHSVITAAQELLDRGTTPKPLPAAALFKAYDEVLPQHGIDPDSDNHLSTLVFRVGGEQGDGTLSQKFQAILGRMGIVLEFGDDTTSLQSQYSHPLSPAPFYTSHQYRSQKQGGLGVNVPHKTTHKSHISSLCGASASEAVPSSAAKIEDDFENTGQSTKTSLVIDKLRSPTAQQASDQGYDGLVMELDPLRIGPKAEDILSFENNRPSEDISVGDGTNTQCVPSRNVRRATLAFVLDRWRDAMNRRNERKPDNTAPGGGDGRGSQTGTRDRDEDANPSGTKSCSYVDVQANSSPVTKATEMNKAENHESESSHVTLNDSLEDGSPMLSHDKRNRTPTHYKDTKVKPPEERHEQLLSRAARAREIYLASKVFNHWADRTATRLEREGVARRHMVRFRCFRGWSQAPSSRAPVLDQLRTITAVQKLQRAVAYQEEQLRITASVIAQNYQLKMALQVFERWCSHLTIHALRQRAIEKTKSNALKAWASQTKANTTVRHAMSRRKGHFDKIGALSKWQHQSQMNTRRFRMARQVGMLRLSFDHLGQWWDEAEIKRRSLTYRENLLIEAAGHAFHNWNLRVREQAFRWRNDYLSITRALDKWRKISAESRWRQDVTSRHFEKQCISKFMDVLKRSNHDHAQLARLDSRARLFIVVTRTLPVLDVAVERRKSQVKETLRRYLMMRYTQVSSARKKRKFYEALDHWRTMADQMHDKVELAASSEAARDALRLQNALSKWRRRATTDARLQLITTQYHRQAWLATWSDLAKEHEQRSMYCWELWAVGKQRQYLKEWSISSLQRSGQAHTAVMVQLKYYGEKRNRTFHQWRQAFWKASDAPFELGLRFTPKAESFGGHKSGWKTLSARRHFLQEGLHERDTTTGPIETPTRWTGAPTSMSFALSSRLMPSVREADEESVLSSGAEEAEILKSPSKPHTSAASTVGLPSTTPRAPVPVHLGLDTLPSHDIKPERFGRSVAMRSVRTKSRSPSNKSSYFPTTSTPRSHIRQPRNMPRYSVQGITPRHSGRLSEGLHAHESQRLTPMGLSESSKVQPHHSMSVTLQPAAPKEATVGFRSPWPQRKVQQAHSRSLTSMRPTKQGQHN